MEILNKILSPEDLKKLKEKELFLLSKEIREFLLQVVSSNGGHLASNLGVVELSIALHYTFSSPKDKIIWDVGHQAYVHKLITGRYSKFRTLRKFDGISGFPKRIESKHDVYETGHSSTSISAAVGMAKARDLAGLEHEVIAVIGDGALTGGLAFEALNYAGGNKNDLIVVLNDNEMSIANNVGSLSSYLTRIRVQPTYSKVKSEIDYILNNIPAIGKSIYKTAEKLKDTMKYLVVPGMLFEELGFSYFGPVNGHDIKKMISTLESVKKTKGPKLIHILTEKGKGYTYAEKNPDKFHGISSFSLKTGNCIKKNKLDTYSTVFGNKLCELATTNEKIVAISAAMTDGTGLKKFSKAFPSRFIDVGIAEQHALTMAAGLASCGYKPVVAIYSTFLQRGYDQIVHDICLQKLPVIIAIDRAGIVGEDGETHHGSFDISYLRHIPNILILAPKDKVEFEKILETITNKNFGPVAIRYPKGTAENIVAGGDKPFKFLEWETLKLGQDINIFTFGSMVPPSLEAANKLEKIGISVGVINCRSIKPMDTDLITRVLEYNNNILTVEENSLQGGFGSSLNEHLIDANHNYRLHRLGIPDRFVQQGNRKELLESIGLSSKGIYNTIYKLIYNNKKGGQLFEIKK